ncbi:MAG: MAPEG family protein [Pseudomonadota bacterium]
MLLPITAVYASLTALVFLVLSIRVITYRRANRYDLGDADDRKLLKRIRAQGNCAEYAPFGLLLLAIAELQTASPLILHVLGLMLVFGRILHALALSLRRQDFRLRIAGMLLTLTMIASTALGLLIQAMLF